MADPSSDTNKKSTPVYFASIEVENVLCFKTRQKLDLCNANGFPAQWTVIIGDNGVGKTTLLRCIAGMKPYYIERMEITVPQLFQFGLWRESPIKLEPKTSKIIADFSCGIPLIYWADDLLNKNAKSQVPEKVTLVLEGLTVDGDFDEIFDFQCYCYGANRKTGKVSLSESLSSDSISSLFSDDDTLISAEEWLLKTDYAVARSSAGNNKFKERFELVIQTLKQLLPDVTDIRIAPANNKRSSPTAEFLTPYGWVSISSLGLGYRTVIAWMVDLSARMIQDYPDSENPLAEPAVYYPLERVEYLVHQHVKRSIQRVQLD